MNKQPTKNPKAQQFTEELNSLCSKYQYKLVPKITVTENGLVPRIDIVDVIPVPNQSIKKVIKKPAKKRKK